MDAERFPKVNALYDSGTIEPSYACSTGSAEREGLVAGRKRLEWTHDVYRVAVLKFAGGKATKESRTSGGGGGGYLKGWRAGDAALAWLLALSSIQLRLYFE